MEARGITKLFPGVAANENVDFTVAPGEIHALLGENGAGKTTLASVLAGLYRPDAGHILIGGRPVSLESPRHALELGVGMVHQHFRLVRRFTVAENVALGDVSDPLVLSRSRIGRSVSELSGRYGLDVDPEAVTETLSVGEQQRVEIVRMLRRGADILLLDEPTSGLTPQEIEALFSTIRRMATEGKSVVLITHKLREGLEVSDRVTVMRAGRVAGFVETESTTERELATLMIGRATDQPVRATSTAPGDAVLSVDGVYAGPAGAKGSLSDVTFAVRSGEIVGVAGVAGNGQVTLAELVAGLRLPDRGRVSISGVEISGRGPLAARRRGLAYVPEDRLGTGLAPGMSVADNLMLTRRRPSLLSRRRIGAEASRLMDRFSIQATGPWAKTSELSGGNLQKVLLARELTADPVALLIASPTRGLDVGSVEFVHRAMLDLRSRGGGILMISEDLDEILALSDRVLVLYEGRIVLEQPGERADVMELGLAMAGRGR
jgi:general nucleoside transport system ATP-binding protein